MIQIDEEASMVGDSVRVKPLRRGWAKDAVIEAGGKPSQTGYAAISKVVCVEDVPFNWFLPGKAMGTYGIE